MSQLKLGMVGLDTSHCTAFCELLHNEENPHHISGGRVVVAYPGGSQAFASSRDRVAKFTEELQQKHQVSMVPDIAAVAEQADAIFLESVDGRQHLEQFRALAPYGKPVFIDKPLATTVEEAQAIFDLAAQHGTPVCTASSLRYASGLMELGAGRQVLGCHAFGPMAILDDFPGYFWYGIHSAEVLYAKMGKGCQSVSVRATADADAIVGIWADGRIGTLYGFRYKKLAAFGATVFTADGVEQGVAGRTPPYYATMLPLVLDFFRTGRPIVDPAESWEVIAFLEAANAARAGVGDVPLAK